MLAASLRGSNVNCIVMFIVWASIAIFKRPLSTGRVSLVAIKPGYFAMVTHVGLDGDTACSAYYSADSGVGFGVGYLQKISIFPVRRRSAIELHPHFVTR